MSIPSEPHRSHSGLHGQPGPVSSDELLPPVEPPSGRFIIQLFVIPALIVGVLFCLWLLIGSLARRGEQNPDQIVAALRSNNQARFQRANELAGMLNLPQQYPELKTNHELAEKLADYVNELVEAGDSAEASVTMRYILVSTLGEFYVPDGLPALLNAARNDPERDVRRQAINAIAVLCNAMANLKPPQPIESQDLNKVLIDLANDQDELIRSGAAFAIGVAAASTATPDPQLVSALEHLADDPYTDARFNAAAGLARIGDPQAAPAIAEMLDPGSLASSVSGEKPLQPQTTDAELAAQKTRKRDMVVSNALKAIEQLLEQPSLPAASFITLQKALEKFIAAAPSIKEPAPIHADVLNVAERLLTKVKARAGQS
jgi:HEAT repeat protein